MSETAPKQQDKMALLKSKAQEKFEAVQKSASELSLKCNNIIITNDTELSMATQLLYKANEQLKLTKEKGLEMREPYNQANKIILEIEKSITGDLEKSIAAGKEKLKEWNTKVEAAKKEEEAKKQKIRDKLIAIEKQLAEKVAAAQTPERCKELKESVEKNFPAFEVFGELAADAKTIKLKYIDQLVHKWKVLQNKSAEEAKKVIEAIDQENAKQVESTIASIEAKSEAATEVATAGMVKSKTRKTWKYEVVDKTKMPLGWLMPDDEKIKAHLSSNKDLIKDGDEIRGIRFYIEETPILG